MKFHLSNSLFAALPLVFTARPSTVYGDLQICQMSCNQDSDCEGDNMMCLPDNFAPCLKNVAPDGTASASSEYDNPSYPGNPIGYARLANDGNTDSFMSNEINGNNPDNSVFHSGIDDSNPWWQVELENGYFIETVKVYSRGDHDFNRLEGFTLKVFLGGNEVFSETDERAVIPRGAETTISVNVQGDTVKIENDNGQYIELAEVEVFGRTYDNTCIDKSPSSPPTYSPGPEYRLTFEECTFQEDESTDVGDITCDFTAMGGKDHTVSSALYGFDSCDGEAPTGVSKDSPDGASLDDDKTVDTVWPFQEHSDYSVTISLASAAANNRQGKNTIQFCLRTEVNDSNGYVQYWESRKIEFDVTIKGDFTTGETLSTSVYDGIEQTVEDVADYEFGVTAFRCDSTGASEDDDKELALGENFFLCVEGEQDNVRITSIETLSATKTGKSLGLISGASAQNQNTYVYGEGDKKVVIATRLTADFFEDGQSVTLSGVANLETGERRQLSIRNMQAADAEGSGFSMEVGIVPSNGSGASAFKATISVFAAAVVALFV